MATHVLNSMVNRVGSTFVHRLSDRTGAKAPQVVRAYLAAREVMGDVALWQQIEALDNRVPDAVQSEMLIEEGWLTARATTWFLRSRRLGDPMEQTFERFRPAVEAVLQRLAPEAGRVADGVARGWLPACRCRWRSGWRAPTASTPRSTSRRWRKAARRSVAEVAEVHAGVGARLGLARLRGQIDALPADSHWQALAKDALGDDLARLQRSITQRGAGRERGAGRPACWPRGSVATPPLWSGRSGCWRSWPTRRRWISRCCRWRCASCGTWLSWPLPLPRAGEGRGEGGACAWR